MNQSRLPGLSGDLAEKSPAPIQPLDFIIAYLGLLAGEGGKTVYKRIVCLLAAAVFFMTGLKASAGYYYDRRGRSVAAPDTYVAGGLLDGNALGIGSFDAIGDLYVDGEEALYIADTGNDRVVVLSADDTVRRVVETVETDEGPVPLNAPEGVFYHNGLLYICNTGGGEVLAVDADNRVVRRLGKPESASLSEEAVFKPSKVAVNASGAVFVAASGIYLGLLQYGTDDVFANFFGAAKVEVTPDVVLAAMWKSLFTDAQRESLKREISTEYANLFIDSEDFVFTVTSTVNEKQVSRLNAAGENILKYPGYDDASLFTSGYNRNNFGDQEFDYSKGYKIVSQLTDLHVDAEGILTVLDSRRGKVLQFDSELNPIGVFGGTGDQRGFFRGAAALEKQGEAYLIADGDKNTITRMVPTGYIRTVREALAGYRQGEYARSEELWNEVLASNPHFTVAYRSIGRALLADGDCRAAMDYLREGDDRYYYSLALQEYRRDFIRNNLLWLLPAMLAVLAGLVVGWRRLKRWLQS